MRNLSAENILTLQHSDVFRSVSPDSIVSLLDALDARVQAFDKNALLFSAGDPIDDYLVLLSGSVQASMPQGGVERPVARFSKGESFAEAVSMTLHFSPVNIVAREKSLVLFIPVRNLASNAQKEAAILRGNLSKEMSKKIGVLSQNMSIAGEQRLSDKIIAHLKTLPQRADGTVELPYSRQEWAAYLCVAEKSLLRELKKMQSEGVLEINGRIARVLG